MRRVVIGNRRGGPTDGLWWRVPLALCAWLPIAAPLVAAMVAVAIYAEVARGVPPVPDLDAFARAAPRTSVILAADGTVLAELPFRQGAEVGHRRWLRAGELPSLLVNALLAAEDVRFFSHAGVDARAVLRAARRNYEAGRTVEGASTITQQLARNLLPVEIGRERSMRRKLREMLLARRIERRWSKPRILEAYANLVFLGAGAYGVGAAADAYFGKPVGELTLAESALVAGMAQAPGATNPFEQPAAAKARRDEVLGRMARAGFVSAAEAAAAAAEPIALAPRAAVYGRVAPWHTERARLEVEAGWREAYDRGGLTVETVAQPVLAAAAEDAAREHTGSIGARQKRAAPAIAAFGVDQTTGYVEVLVGGLDWKTSPFDRAWSACRQPGSTFKPLVFAAGYEMGALTPGTPLRDAPVSEYDEDRDVFWKPRNSGRAFRGVALAHDALVASLNAPSVDAMDRVGPAAAIDLARRLGISSELDAVRPLVLGASCVVPRELARAFGAFAGGGRLPETIVVTRVRAGATVLVDRAAPEDPWLDPARRLDRVAARLDARAAAAATAPALDPQAAYLVAFSLVDAARSGTGRDARAAGRPVAGKTGTTNDNSDAWFVGWTARLVLAVWVGHDDPAVKLGAREDGARAALPLWTRLVRLAEADRPARPALGPPPAGVVTAVVDRESGKLGRGGGGAIELPFKPGTVPTESADPAAALPEDLERDARSF